MGDSLDDEPPVLPDELLRLRVDDPEAYERKLRDLERYMLSRELHGIVRDLWLSEMRERAAVTQITVERALDRFAPDRRSALAVPAKTGKSGHRDRMASRRGR